MPEIAPGITGTPSQLSTTGIIPVILAGVSVDSGIIVGGSNVGVASMGISVCAGGVGMVAFGEQAHKSTAMPSSVILKCFIFYSSGLNDLY
jgi:aconitase B